MSKDSKALSTIEMIRNNVSVAFTGNNHAIDMLLIALICGGHVLIEDVPGLGKTTLASALAKSLDCSFRRIQFTPDVLPTDITGFISYNMSTGEREVHFGSVMAQIVLADEINRTGPKTQSSLLEAMQEGNVTIDGETYPVPQPFFVIATQNPSGQIGTYPLPESQLDRFLMKISLGYPSSDAEKNVLISRKANDPLKSLRPVATADDILSLREARTTITCSQHIIDYIISITSSTRSNEKISLGVSPRGSLALMNASMACAMLNGRDYVLPDDVQGMAEPVLAHRIMLNRKQFQGKETAESIIGATIRSIKVPGVS
ncbi:MAG: MoxR family ATPase [Clostridiaceae bacterium]|nr:MoxR family ATPase [Clostridiaceae bacterium]